MKNIIKNAFIEILSGIARYHKDGGVIAKDNSGSEITILFPTKSQNYVVVRSYYDDDGNKKWEAEYHKGKPHGKYIGWYENGNKFLEAEYKHGKLINEKCYGY